METQALQGSRWRRAGRALAAAALVASGTVVWSLDAQTANAAEPLKSIVPAPVSVQATAGVTHTLTSTSKIYTQAGNAAARTVGDYLAGVLRKSTGFALPISDASGTPADGISLLLTGANGGVGDQGYQLDVTTPTVVLRANTATGLFGGVPGGFYTKAQYQEIIAYAATKFITVIPEVDLPGHTNAALTSYAELNCNGVAPAPRTDTAVGYSSLCVSKAITYQFLDDVIREIAAITPGPYFHLGGDEAQATTDADYQTFMDKTLPIVKKYGKQAIGWHEFVKTTTDTTAIPQFWGTTTSNSVVAAAAARGNKVLMSPANKAYLDMKYNASTPLGQDWAGRIEVQDAYDWNPGAYVTGVNESAVRGVEAPMWTENIVTSADIEYMAFPRLAAIAELGWSPWSTHNWDQFTLRLAAHGPRWTTMGINFYKSTQVPWETTTPTTTTTTTTTTPPGNCSAAWDRTKVYTATNVVSHNTRKWTAQWWTQGEEPGTTGQWGVWRDSGAC